MVRQKAKSRKAKKPQAELEFAPVDSKITIDLSPETFKHSDEFSSMMDRAHRLAIRRNDSFVAGNRGRERDA